MPRTPTPFKNALAAQEKMHGPLKMEVRGKCANMHLSFVFSLYYATFIYVNFSLFWTVYGSMILWLYLYVCLCFSATAIGISRGRHSRGSKAGDWSRLL